MTRLCWMVCCLALAACGIKDDPAAPDPEAPDAGIWDEETIGRDGD